MVKMGDEEGIVKRESLEVNLQLHAFSYKRIK
jgi:hypothetical protein